MMLKAVVIIVTCCHKQFHQHHMLLQAVVINIPCCHKQLSSTSYADICSCYRNKQLSPTSHAAISITCWHKQLPSTSNAAISSCHQIQHHMLPWAAVINITCCHKQLSSTLGDIPSGTTHHLKLRIVESLQSVTRVRFPKVIFRMSKVLMAYSQKMFIN